MNIYTHEEKRGKREIFPNSERIAVPPAALLACSRPLQESDVRRSRVCLEAAHLNPRRPGPLAPARRWSPASPSRPSLSRSALHAQSSPPPEISLVPSS